MKLALVLQNDFFLLLVVCGAFLFLHLLINTLDNFKFCLLTEDILDFTLISSLDVNIRRISEDSVG